MSDGIYFYMSWSEVFQVGRWCHTISYYISTWFNVGFSRLSFVLHLGAASIKLQWKLGDVTFWHSTFGSKIRFFWTLCDCRNCTRIVFQTDRSFLWHQVVGLKSRSNRLISKVLSQSNCLSSNLNKFLFSRVLIGHSIWTGNSKFGPILNLSITCFED